MHWVGPAASHPSQAPSQPRLPRSPLALADLVGWLVLVGVALRPALAGGHLHTARCAAGAGVVVARESAPVAVGSTGLAHVGHRNVVVLASGLAGAVGAEVGGGGGHVAGGALAGRAPCAFGAGAVAL